MAASSRKEDKFHDYEGFVEKFKPKKTTDDCYTPEPVYNALLDWIDRNITPLEGRNILRPFWPGADFEKVDYKPGDIVIDNPPFSIVSRICRWYAERGILYFLFAPSLTLFSSPVPGETNIVAHAEIRYENGASVRTSFRTNLLGGCPAVMVSGDLFNLMAAVQRKPDKRKRKIIYPDCLITPGTLGRLAVRGINISFNPEDVHFVRTLDCGLNIFGSGYLLSERAAAERAAAERAAAERAAAERAAAERAAAERAAAERAAAERAVLSTREIQIIKVLGHG